MFFVRYFAPSSMVINQSSKASSATQSRNRVPGTVSPQLLSLPALSRSLQTVPGKLAATVHAGFNHNHLPPIVNAVKKVDVDKLLIMVNSE